MPDGSLGIHTKIEDWDTLNWAQQTALRASCGFDESGQLSLTTDEVSGSALTYKAVQKATSQPGGWALPKGITKGADQRLQQLLENSRTNLFEVNHDRWGLHHQGPDGSVIYTSRRFWGALKEGYPEVQEKDLGDWEQSDYGTPEAPCWTCPECNGFLR